MATGNLSSGNPKGTPDPAAPAPGKPFTPPDRPWMNRSNGSGVGAGVGPTNPISPTKPSSGVSLNPNKLEGQGAVYDAVAEGLQAPTQANTPDWGGTPYRGAPGPQVGAGANNPLRGGVAVTGGAGRAGEGTVSGLFRGRLTGQVAAPTPQLPSEAPDWMPTVINEVPEGVQKGDVIPQDHLQAYRLLVQQGKDPDGSIARYIRINEEAAARQARDTSLYRNQSTRESVIDDYADILRRGVGF